MALSTEGTAVKFASARLMTDDVDALAAFYETAGGIAVLQSLYTPVSADTRERFAGPA